MEKKHDELLFCFLVLIMGIRRKKINVFIGILRKRIGASFCCVLSQICDLRYLDFVIYRNLST